MIGYFNVLILGKLSAERFAVVGIVVKVGWG